MNKVSYFLLSVRKGDFLFILTTFWEANTSILATAAVSFKSVEIERLPLIFTEPSPTPYKQHSLSLWDALSCVWAFHVGCGSIKAISHLASVSSDRAYGIMGAP